MLLKIQLLILALLTVSCDLKSHSIVNVYNGEVVEFQDKGAFHNAALEVTYKDGVVGHCSASVVGPRALLSAAHCVEDEDIAKIDAYFALNKSVSRKVIWYRYSGDSAINENLDLSILELDEQVPDFVVPAYVAQKNETLESGTLYGFGMETDNDISQGIFGTLRKIEVLCNTLGDLETTSKRCHSVKKEGLAGAARKGDSGGGVARWYPYNSYATIVGVTWGRSGLISKVVEVSLMRDHLMSLNKNCRLTILGLPCL